MYFVLIQLLDGLDAYLRRVYMDKQVVKLMHCCSYFQTVYFTSLVNFPKSIFLPLAGLLWLLI